MFAFQFRPTLELTAPPRMHRHPDVAASFGLCFKQAAEGTKPDVSPVVASSVLMATNHPIGSSWIHVPPAAAGPPADSPAAVPEVAPAAPAPVVSDARPEPPVLPPLDSSFVLGQSGASAASGGAGSEESTTTQPLQEAPPPPPPVELITRLRSSGLCVPPPILVSLPGVQPCLLPLLCRSLPVGDVPADLRRRALEM